jgi:glycosyltransferase involved in cell wall biosynthesis
MIIQRYHPHVGGAETQLRALGPRLRARGIEPYVLTRRLPGTRAQELVDGVPVFRLPAPGGKLTAATGYLLGSLLTLVGSRLKGLSVMHAHELLSPATVGLTAKWLNHRPLVVKVLRGGALSDLKALAKRPLGKQRQDLYLRQVDRFISLSSEIDEELLGAGARRQQVVRIPNGVDIARFEPASASERAQQRHRLGLSEGPTAVFTGRLAPEKRIDQLVRVWPQVRARVPDAQLVVVGDGPLAPALKDQAGTGVALVGQSPNVPDYLRASDLFVLPSLAEGLSNAMLEAMASGVPSVLHPHGGAVDVATEGENARFLANDSDDALANTVAEALDDRAWLTVAGSSARERVVNNYSLDATADRLASLYRELAVRT